MSNGKPDLMVQLRIAIVQLELQQEEDGSVLKQQLRAINERLTATNLLKGAIGAVYETKSNIVAASVGLSLGVLAKALFEGATAGPLRKVLGTLLFFGMTKVASPTNINSLGSFFTRLSGRSSENTNQVSSS